MSQNSKKKRDARKRADLAKRNQREARRRDRVANERPHISTPAQITEEIRRFCTQLVGEAEPIFVPVRRWSGSKTNDCYQNVAKRVGVDGGKILYGWMVMEWPGVLLEAQFHAVWEATNGELLDLTPTADREERVLFLHDGGRKYEGRLIESRQAALSSEPLVNEYIRLCERKWSMEARAFFDTGDEAGMSFSDSDRDAYLAIVQELKNVLTKLVAAHAPA